MFLAREDVQLLTDIGFTKTQAKLYLTLLKLGQANGNSLAKNAEITRQVVYRTLDELQNLGLVQKEIGRPNKFTATPIRHGLNIIMTQRRKQYNEIQEKAKGFLQKMQNYNRIKDKDQKHKFSVLEGRERIIQIFKQYHKNAQKTIDGLSTLTRLLQVIHYCHEEFIAALEKRVQFRVVIQKPSYEISFSEEVEDLLVKPNFALKFSSSPLRTNSGIFDNKEATICFFPSKPIGESPLLLTDHPSFLSMAKDHFEATWKSAEKY